MKPIRKKYNYASASTSFFDYIEDIFEAKKQNINIKFLYMKRKLKIHSYDSITKILEKKF